MTDADANAALFPFRNFALRMEGTDFKGPSEDPLRIEPSKIPSDVCSVSPSDHQTQGSYANCSPYRGTAAFTVSLKVNKCRNVTNLHEENDESVV